MKKDSRKLFLIVALIMPTVGYAICKDIFKNGIRDGKETQLKQAAHQKK
jgi:hypothetical protein